MEENFECEFNLDEEYSIRNCSKLDIDTIINDKIATGAYGTIYPVIVNDDSKKKTLILKKISSYIPKDEQKKYIKNMYYEVNYSYNMGKFNVGPIVYDAFFYKNKDDITQIILMEKFDMSIANWLLCGSKSLTPVNCNYVSSRILELLHKQIFTLNTFCCDIKVDNFVLNINPFKVRMIDFGIEWCSNSILPSMYEKIQFLKKQTDQVKKEIFYSLCVLQVFVNIVHINVPLNVIKMFLKSFYKDDLFIKYILENELSEILKFEKSHTDINSNTNIRKLLNDILNYKDDQSITLKYYIKKNESQTNDEIVNYVFDLIKKITLHIFKPSFDSSQDPNLPFQIDKI